MPVSLTIQDPLHWENFGNNMSEPTRRNSLLPTARRNSLFSGISLFDFSMYPPVAYRTEHDEVDPFAPLAIDDGFHHSMRSTTKELPQVVHSSHFHLLTDRSESSQSSPSQTSSSSASTQVADHLYSSTADNNSIYYQRGASSHQEHFDDTLMDAIGYPLAAVSNSYAAQPSDSHLDEEDEDTDGQRFKRFHEEKWSHRYKELLAFHREFGHSAVPHTYPRNPQLARWVKRQRRQYKLRRDSRPSTMTLERLQLLDNVGFVWDSHDVNWREKLTALDAFRRENGHCNVPSNYVDKKLATWVKCQRRQYKLYVDRKPSAMTEERIMELGKRGFEWEIRSSSSKLKVTLF